jgi:hypothetical protein
MDPGEHRHWQRRRTDLRFPAILLMAALAASAARGNEGKDATPVEAAPGEAPARLVVGDEVDRLEQALRLPHRFAGYVPAFRVEWRTFAFQHVSGPLEKRWQVVWDGDKFVALVLSGDIHLAAFDPGRARTRLDLPSGRYHMDHFVGPKIDTYSLLESVKDDPSVPADELQRRRPREEWIGAGRALTFVRRQVTPTREVANRFTFTADPVYGYRIDATYEAAFAAPPAGKVRMSSHSYCPGIYIPWKENELYDYTIYTRVGDGPDQYHGWASNLYCIDRCQRLPFADPGFIAYLSKAGDGWSPCYTRSDGAGPSTIGQCNAGHGPAFSYPVPALEAGPDGKYRFRAVRRLFALPPEARRHILERTTLHQSGVKGLFLRMGIVEGFEDQPIDLARPTRGLIWTGGGPPLAEGIARTGTRSLLVGGRVWPNLPQVILKPETRYRLQGWFKVVPWPAEELAEAKKKDQARRDDLAKRGKALPEPTDWAAAKPRAYLRGDLFEWSPHTGPMLVQQTTGSATGASGEWEHVVLDFTTPLWDPFINISINAEYCTAYLDDFQLAPAGKGADP